MDPLSLAEKLLAAGPICDPCLGRRFALLPGGLTNPERGALLRAALAFGPVPPEECWVCGGAFARIPAWAQKAWELARPYEFHTFLFGVHLSPRLEATEEFLAERFPSPWAEPVRRHLNRALGQAFAELLRREGRTAQVDYGRPDVQFLVDMEKDAVELQVNPAVFYGRYRKLVRGIAQTAWTCPHCRGRGCGACGGTGKLAAASVEELVLPVFLEATGGVGGHLHGAGREDADARMLGRGRPFLLTVEGPRRRRVDLAWVAEEVRRRTSGAVELLDLRPATPELEERVKSGKFAKRYLAKVSFSAPVAEEAFQRAVAGLVGEIRQRTPERVRHRRADLVRRRRVLAAQGRLLSPTEAELEITCEAGLYVKELVSGDRGGTEPSLAALLGTAATVTELDVLDILDDAGVVGPEAEE
ncbi:MAG: tRNA pseudouridine(54/55) synthase Pus10 [Candidatus Bipolaricaulota bacterium]|nr:tRNA pseudouridine(54/55) synthase Pus10 [Candidatus Bipolaricaulota bacterium]